MSIPEKIVFVGDFCFSGDEIAKQLSNSRINPWARLQAVFSPESAIIANLECPFTNAKHGKPLKWANLKADPQLHWTLDGISMAVLGNNHIGDFGEQGVNETLAILADKGIATVGYGESLTAALQPTFIDLSTGRLGIVALCCPTTNSENLATHQTPGVAPLGMATLKQAVVQAKPHCDALVVYLHWGREWVHDPVPDQLRLARYAIDLGADAVIGCHSHTIQSFEQYKGRWIFYGLGNYLFKAGFGQAVRENGLLENVPLRLDPPNRESLAVAFKLVKDTGSGCLALEQMQAMRYGDDWIPQVIDVKELTFDLDAANTCLANYIAQHGDELDKRSEPVLLSRLYRGYSMAYWYSKTSL